MTVQTFIPTAKAATENTVTQPSHMPVPTDKAVKKLYIETQGCQMNEYDSHRMADLLGDSHGYVLTTDPKDADILLMNTCSIREKAQEKVFSELGRWRKLKEQNPELVIGVGGCVASQEGDTIQKRAPYVDMVFGPQTLHRLPQMLDQHHEQTAKPKHQKIKLVDISFPDIEKFDYLPEPRVEGHKAFVSIMEGCSKYCSFCVVPYTRGEEVSRPLDDVLAEIATLAEKGVREVSLLGQNVNGYRGETFEGSICTFAELLRLVAEIPGIGRIRYTTSHPLEFSDELIECYRDLPQMVSHLHLPVQSGCNDVLKAMKRNHTIDVYIDKIARLRKVRPDMHLSSDFIIGFPGETDQNFQETLQFIQDLDFDHSYSFVYSKRPGTPAAELADDTPDQVKKDRLAQVQKIIKQSSIEKTDAMLGQVHRVLIEKISDQNPDYLIGTADNTRLVSFVGNPEWVGRFAEIEVTEIKTLNLVYGELLNLEPDVA
ncbi:tRNA (N6-isopentenyl adenosine(37)-C2)-methylthiotransferase MiaB [Acinetobacter qingfengensis]|uniref:tRNA-2-methylthio-N(6)-dimethylallyladenosine synthase n=1 Tax=Acinetobacter qingfengensis TaxID=1262585 RepID=A0A1E7RAX2_9GAMM|nr:tRNA (N6-isopentenyl adenosine(37)-C2)-methylthiotransferase MiaB [Acinetobacter qingfengensis]KAA8734554.1 tRNA (N6-isopentenyl adenosine(37)-C2)-methylthiotransferase MiaB [Acinetobacter qingfengensis]OEY96395.1 tRNA (N6-isopentenyl adenosine(37)-C2)-methylthiotransferase MiaB [Acinetobacter qingfengensis]